METRFLQIEGREEGGKGGSGVEGSGRIICRADGHSCTSSAD